MSIKQINTLVEDIYGLFNKGFKATEADTLGFGRRLATHIQNRIGELREKPTLRLSNLGTPCNRKLWYTINTPSESEPLSGETAIKFLFGDILEELLLFLAGQAGHRVDAQQEEVDINGVKGHKDGYIDGVLVDVKSASSRSFTKFQQGTLREDDPFGYLDQLNGYLFASQDDGRLECKDQAAFLVIDKQLGKICLDIQPRNDVDYNKVVDEKRKTISQPAPPERPYQPVADGKSGNLKLSTVCSYCDFKHPCWKDSNDGKGLRVFLYSTGPRYLTQVSRTPDVIEVDQQRQAVERA
jgi:hypothetical protein